MHLISELPGHLEITKAAVCEENMITKKDMSLLESILYLRAVQQCAGKRKASESLNTSIDTLNKYIDNLEDYFGLKLISSNGRGCDLTETAKRIVDKTSKIKEVLEDIYSIKLNNQEIKGEVRVFMALCYASYIVPHDLSALFDVFPELRINSITALEPLSFNIKDVDIAVTYEEMDTQDTVLICEKEVHCGFFASSHYLAQKGYPVDLDDMVNNHRLITENNDLLLQVLGKERFKRANVCFESNNTLALINALENSTGIGILPLSFALHGLVCLDNIVCDCPITYHLYANRLTKDIPRVRTVINFYKDIMSKLENPVPVPALKDELLPILQQMDNAAG